MEIQLDVPYITQLEPDGSGYNNCGPACLTSLLAYNRIVSGYPADMHHVADYIRDGVFDGDWWAGTYTDYPMMQDLCSRIYGVPSEIIRSWDRVFAVMDAGQPVIILGQNWHFEPRQYPATAAFNANHFIVLTGYNAYDFYVNDPLAVYTRSPGWYTGASVRAGVAGVGGVYALALSLPDPNPMPDPEPTPDPQPEPPPGDIPPPPWDGLWLELVKQRDDLVSEVAALKKERDMLVKAHADISKANAYNYNLKMAFEAYVRSVEGRRVRVPVGKANSIISSVPIPTN